MGYAIFTARKLMLTNRINQLNFRLMQLSQQQMTLSNNAAKLQRALANQKNVFQTIGNIYQSGLTMQQQAYQQGLMAALKQSSGDTSNPIFVQAMQQYSTLGLNGQFNFATTNLGLVLGMMQQQQEAVNESQLQQVKDIENEIELQKKSIETQLKAAQAELQEVEKSEENNIKNSAPKYA